MWWEAAPEFLHCCSVGLGGDGHLTTENSNFLLDFKAREQRIIIILNYFAASYVTMTTREIAVLNKPFSLLILNIQWKVLGFNAEKWLWNTFKCVILHQFGEIFTLTYSIYCMKLTSNLFECYAVSYVGRLRLCAQSCPTLYNPMDCGPPGSSAHGIFLAWILE